MFTNQTVQAVSLATEKNRRGQRPVPIRVRLAGFTGSTYDPNVTCFQLVYQTNEIRDAGHGNVLQSSGRDLRNNTRQTNGASFRDKDAVNSGTFGGAQDWTHVTRVFDCVESQRQ